jgi:hypothetical protein
LLGQHGADQSDEGVAVGGKMPTASLRRRISRLSRSNGLSAQIRRQSDECSSARTHGRLAFGVAAIEFAA